MHHYGLCVHDRDCREKPELIQKSLLDEEFEKYYVAAKLQHGSVHIVHVYKLLSYSCGKKKKINGI